MAVGQNALMGNLSYLAVGREITYGTYVTATAGLNFLSANITTVKETKILEEIQTNRTNSNFIQLGKVIEGEIEFYFSPKSVAANYLLHNAFGGGAITSATATGETIGGTAFTHTIGINNFDVTYSSLTMNMRKGDSTSAKLFEYTGIRVNELTFTSEIDEPLLCNVSFFAKDSTLGTNDVSSSINTLTHIPLSFVNGRVSIETSTAGITTTSFWHVQSMEFKISNNLQAEASARRIGSDTLQVLPAGLANFEFKATIRFDTTTAYAAMMNGTRLVGEFEFLGDTLAGSAVREGIKLTMPYLIISNAGDPEVAGPNEPLVSEVVFAVLRDPTSGGYAVQAKVTNITSSYA